MTHRSSNSDGIVAIAAAAVISALIIGVTFLVPSHAPAPACRPHYVVELTALNGLQIEFAADHITVVMSNSGDYPADAHAVVSTDDSHEYGVRQSVSEVTARLHEAKCQ